MTDHRHTELVKGCFRCDLSRGEVMIDPTISEATYDGMTASGDQRAFVGWQPRECGEHRTVGDYRAWCFQCSEWCYSATIGMACKGCEIPHLRASASPRPPDEAGTPETR